MKILRIGIDFDGVIADTPAKKIEIALKKFGINVPIEECNKDGFIQRGFTGEMYKQMQEMVYSTHELNPIFGCLAHLKKLVEEGNEICIVSYRKAEGLKIISNFLAANDLKIKKFICTDNKPKSDFCKKMNFDVFIDDRTEHLTDLRSYVKNLFLFDTPYNREEKLADGIIRCDWKEFYQLVHKIAR